jgi:DNA-directed RNA polymerase III subunit RPC1
MSYETNIKHIQFSVASEDSIFKQSEIQVETPNLYHNQLPIENGISDLHMGAIDHRTICSSCLNDSNNCPGHFGHLKLKYPVIQPMYFDMMIKWLNIVCHRCGRLLVSEEDLKNISDKQRLQKTTELVKLSSNQVCKHCKKNE